MTTSFTTSDEFDPQESDFGTDVEYPELFGITFTPKVTGITIGVGGFLIAAYLAWSQVIPALTQLSELNNTRDEKQEQLDRISSDELDNIIAQRKGQLQEAQDLKEDVMALFTNDQTLQTLLLDVSTFANLSNVTLNSYTPTGEKQPLADDSLGNLATNNVQVQTFNLDIEGTFSQTQLLLQDLERLQPLLVVQNLNSSTLEPPVYLFENNQLITVGEPKIKTTITVQAVFADVKPPPAENPEEEQ